MITRIELTALAGCAVFALLLSRDFATIGRQGDSAAYFAGAESFARSGSLLLPTGKPNVTWPPGYIIALAPHHWVGVSVAAYARLWHVALLLMLAVLARTAIRTAVPEVSPPKAVGCALAIAAFPPTLYVTSNAVSELQYAVLALGALLLLSAACRATETAPARKALAGAALLAACALMTRLQAVSLLGAGGLVILLDRGGSPARRARWIAALWAPALILLGMWLARNQAVSGMLRPPGGKAHPIFRYISSMPLSYVSAIVPVFGQDYLNRAAVAVRWAAIALVELPLVSWSLWRLQTALRQQTAGTDIQSVLIVYGLVELLALPIMARAGKTDDFHFRFIHASSCMFLLVFLIELARKPASRTWWVAGSAVAAFWAVWGLAYVHVWSRAWNN